MKRWSAFAALMGGCSIGEVDMALNGDMDDDGYLDFDEEDAFTDPEDPDDHPYKGGYAIDACRFDLPEEGTGTSVGDIAPNFELTDQHGETVRLHDFCNQAVLIESSAYW